MEKSSKTDIHVGAAFMIPSFEMVKKIYSFTSFFHFYSRVIGNCFQSVCYFIRSNPKKS